MGGWWWQKKNQRLGVLGEGGYLTCSTLKKKVEQIIRECSGRSIAKSPVNDKGIRYNRNGMLPGRLNVVNVGLLLGAEEDE